MLWERDVLRREPLLTGRGRVMWGTLAPAILRLLVRVVCGTLRYHWVGLHQGLPARKDAGPVIYAFWHARFFPLIYTHRHRRIRVLVSHHRDGELVSRVICGMGFGTVRGSTTRGGREALYGVARALRSGDDVAVTPDGPRGPREVAQPGAVVAARLSGRQIVPVATATWPVVKLRSWDRYRIPVPFARCVVSYGPPLSVPRDASPPEIEGLRRELDRRLARLTLRADEQVRLPGGRWSFGTRYRRRHLRATFGLAWLRGAVSGPWRVLGWPLSQLWRAATLLRRKAYRWRALRSRGAGLCTVSVGNLSVGGTGKTPLVMSLAQVLQRQGSSVLVLTKGYGAPRAGGHVWTATADGPWDEWKWTGDEAVLAARTTGAPVVSCRDRARGIRDVSDQRFRGVILLDDGFQALQIRRNFDVVLVSERQPLDARSVFPVGPLREGPEALGAADFVVMTGGEGRSERRWEDPDRPVVHAVRRLAGFYSWPSGTRARIEDLTAWPLLAFAGLADPQGFWDDLEHSGFTVASRVAFPDHHHYRPCDLHGLSSAARQVRAVAMVTTEKDAVRIPPWVAPELPVWVARMELTIQGSAWQLLVDSIRETVNRHENK